MKHRLPLLLVLFMPLHLFTACALLLTVAPGHAQDSPDPDSITTNILDPTWRDYWVERRGDWKFDGNLSLTGKGDSRILFRQAFKTPFRLTCNLTVFDGERPGINFDHYEFANGGYTHYLALAPETDPSKKYPYELNKTYKIQIDVTETSVQTRVNDTLVESRQEGLPIVSTLSLRGGDDWSPGTTQFSNILVSGIVLPGYLKNSDLKEDKAYWHGAGDVAYLKPDGTEGSPYDPDVIPVLKIVLGAVRSHEVYQEFKTPAHVSRLHFGVDVFASSDFSRSDATDVYDIDWTGNQEKGGVSIVVPHSDFWIRSSQSNDTHSFTYMLHDLKPGAWTSVDFDSDVPDTEDRVVSFCVPPGQGTIYLKLPSVIP